MVSHSLIASDVTSAMFVERTIAKKSLGNLTLLLCNSWVIVVVAAWGQYENDQGPILSTTVPIEWCYSLIASDVTAAMFVERTIANKSFGNLTLLLCKPWATCFGTNMDVSSRACNQRMAQRKSIQTSDRKVVGLTPPRELFDFCPEYPSRGHHQK